MTIDFPLTKREVLEKPKFNYLNTHTHMHTPQEECKELMKSDPLEHGRKGQSFSVGKKIQEIRIESEILTEKCI